MSRWSTRLGEDIESLLLERNAAGTCTGLILAVSCEDARRVLIVSIDMRSLTVVRLVARSAIKFIVRRNLLVRRKYGSGSLR